MRDVLIVTPPDDKQDWNIDIDIVNGVPRYVSTVENTQDQRAALAALICKGTIPGMNEEGITFGNILEDQDTLVDLNNQVQRQIQKYAAYGDSSKLIQYIPMYSMKEGTVGITVYRA